MNKILILTIIVFQSFNSFSQSFWKIENEYHDEILLTIDLNSEKKTFEAYTRKNALKDLAGIFMYTLAKAAGKLKYPEIVFIEGKTQKKSDSLFLQGIFNYFDKQYAFSATISGKQFKGEYIDNRNRPHILTGLKVPDKKPIKDYVSIINSAFLLTEKNLFNQAWLKSDEWHDFRQKVNELKTNISDDYELAATFFWLGKKLPFSPYEISKKTPGRLTVKYNEVFIKEPKSKTALLSGGGMPSTKKEMDSIALIINKNGYRNLIIDLRGRNRLNPYLANELLNFLSNKTFSAGTYLSRKWFDTNTTVPKAQDYHKLFKDISGSGYKLDESYKEQGLYMNIIPQEKPFRGKTYILTDSKTSKVSEILVYILKKEKIATIVGQKSAGATILSENLSVNNEFDLVLPVSDFYSTEGKSINMAGIEPDIPVSGEDALKYILKLL
jgi:hypothetical protein